MNDKQNHVDDAINTYERMMERRHENAQPDLSMADRVALLRLLFEKKGLKKENEIKQVGEA